MLQSNDSEKDLSHQYATPFYPACTTPQVQWDHSVTHFWERERASERGGIEGGDEHRGKIENIRCLVVWCLTETELTWALEANSSLYPAWFKLSALALLLQSLPKNHPADLTHYSARAPVLPRQARQKSNSCCFLNSTKVSRPFTPLSLSCTLTWLPLSLSAVSYLAVPVVQILVTNSPLSLTYPPPPPVPPLPPSSPCSRCCDKKSCGNRNETPSDPVIIDR